jgi:hypothetical protein
VQLRYPVRGETSAALYRALAAGGACVVSDQGPMAEVPDSVALKIRTPDHEVEDLTAALTRLHEDAATRAALGREALRHARQEHNLAAAVDRYAAAIEMVTLGRSSTDRLWLEQAVHALAMWRERPETTALPDLWAALRCCGQDQLASRVPASTPGYRQSA